MTLRKPWGRHSGSQVTARHPLPHLKVSLKQAWSPGPWAVSWDRRRGDPLVTLLRMVPCGLSGAVSPR